jgi:ferric-dicitrate binding protein FerR (iron transport regulator)
MSDHDGSPVDVEPFTELRWARVERAMFAQLEDRPWDARAYLPPRALLMAVPVIALGAFVFLLVHGLARPPALPEPVRMATRESPSRLTVGESSIVAAHDSLVLIRRDDGRGIEVTVDHGRIDCDVGPLRGRAPFVVDAGKVRVRAVGAAFSVVHDATSTSVEVAHGVAEVVTGGIVSSLHDGDRWENGATGPGASPESPVGSGPR